MVFNTPGAIDYSFYSTSSKNHTPLFCLPNKVSFVRNAISNQRPTITLEYRNNVDVAKTSMTFGPDETCHTCKVEQSKNNIECNMRDRN